MVDPLPCPFCGDLPERGGSEIPRESAYRIRCAPCGVEMIRTDPFTIHVARERAVAAWNRRAALSPTPQQSEGK